MEVVIGVIFKWSIPLELLQVLEPLGLVYFWFESTGVVELDLLFSELL